MNREDFFATMTETATLRRMIVDYRLMMVTDPTHIGTLENALHGLKEAQSDLDLDMSYEISELEKDIVYLREGEEALLAHLGQLHDGFEAEVEQTIAYLKDLPTHLFITDRDGTVNNYCARYRTSVQSVYNAVFLTLYARSRTKNPVILTSAPLEPEGIMEVMTTPRHTFIIAGSKGREFYDQELNRHEIPIPEDQRRMMEQLNHQLEELVSQKKYQQFTQIGSGLQKKFGQTAISYQDVGKSIDQEESQAFKRKVRELVERNDPDGKTLHVEDTGSDLEIILSADGSGSDAPRDFDKADGVRFIDEEAPLGIADTPTLACGDTASDIPMLEHVAQSSPDSRTILVTTDQSLIDKSKKTLPELHVVSTPDSLVAALGRLGGASS